MISIARTAEPIYLSSRKINWLLDLRNARRNRDQAKFKKLQGRYANEKIKFALIEMCHSKCAYCESVIETVATPQIEHFRPKQRYVSLTYVWSNLLLCCPKCNDPAHKGTKFPKPSEGGLLIDPSLENPAAHMEFIYDPITKIAFIRALNARGQTTVDILGLNSRPALLKARSELLRRLLALKSLDGLDAEVTDVLAQARQSRSPYLSWIKKYI